MINENLVCIDSEPGWLGLFDFSIAPELMFYSYIPIAVLVLFFGFFVYRNRKNALSKILLSLSFFFAIWVILEIVNWTAVPVVMVAFTWQLIFIVIPTIFLLTVLFFYNFINKKHPPFIGILLLTIAFLPIIFLLPSDLNFSQFDIYNCENIDSIGWYYIYLFDLLCIVLILILGVLSTRKVRGYIEFFKRLLITLGTAMFLAIFFATTTFADITSLYEFNLLGPLGMLVFVLLVSYSIVKYRAFNIKVLGAQFLIFALVFGNFSLFFIQEIEHVRAIVLVTLVITIIIGNLLLKAVKLVESQRVALEIANQNQENLLNFITHQVKSFLTKSRAVFAGIVEGDFGRVNAKVKEISQEGLELNAEGVETVQDILNAADLKRGIMKFNKEQIDVVTLIQEGVDVLKDSIENKGLKLKLDLPDNPVNIQGDHTKLSEVIKNVLNNALVYTPKGSIKVSLRDKSNRAIISIKDTGVGLSDKDKVNLFTEGGVGEEALKYNTNTSGYGLFISKQIVEEHGGKIYANSKGRGKGTEFVIELPI